MWLKHPRSGEQDTMLTLAVAATVSVLIKFLVSGIEIGTINLGTIDAGVIAAILTPTLGAYVARKYSDKPKTNKSKKETK